MKIKSLFGYSFQIALVVALYIPMMAVFEIGCLIVDMLPERLGQAMYNFFERMMDWYETQIPIIPPWEHCSTCQSFTNSTTQ